VRLQGFAAADSPTWPPAQVPLIAWVETKGYFEVRLELVVNTADGSGLCGVLDHSMNLSSALTAGSNRLDTLNRLRHPITLLPTHADDVA
jgi:hypothetical protein